MTLNNLKHEAEKIRLTSAERSAIRARVFGAPKGQSLESPELRTVLGRRSPYVFMSYHLRMSLAGFVLFVFAGAGTVSAAQNALPGDLLYPVKVSINENVEVILAPTAAAKAAVEVKLAGRRVEEAQALAAQGRLDAATAGRLEENLGGHADRAQKLADAVEETEPGAGADVKATLASSLSTGGAILAQIGTGSSNTSNKEQSGALATRVIARADGPARVDAAARAFAPAAPELKRTEVTISAQGGATLSVMAVATSSEREKNDGRGAAYLEVKAARALSNAKAIFDSTKEQLDATSTAHVQGQFAAADTSMSEGALALKAGEYAQAAQAFTKTLSISARLSALLEAQKKFDGGIIRALIKSNNSGGLNVEINND